MRRKLISLLLSFSLLSLVLFSSTKIGTAQAGDPYSLIAAVNSLRAANGLPALQANSILMSIAQGHSDYQASIGQGTHTGAGGTQPVDRATAAGYGGGGTFSISENYAWGNDMSVDEAISKWLLDDPHIQTMLGASYQDIGAGVAVSNGVVYYTIDVAYISGSGNYVPPATYTPGGPTPMPIYMILTVTPRPDGTVIHVVQSGQTLIGIADAYSLEVQDLMKLNNLTSDEIYVGDKLIVHPANTPGPTDTITPTTTPTRASTPTRVPTRTPTKTPTSVVANINATVDPAEKDMSQPGSDPLGNILVIAIITLAAGGVVLMVIGSFMKRSSKE